VKQVTDLCKKYVSLRQISIGVFFSNNAEQQGISIFRDTSKSHLPFAANKATLML